METFRMAFLSLLGNRTRSLLTMLGIIIGVGAVIVMVSVGNGASSMVEKFVSGFGANLLQIFPSSPKNSSGVRGAAGTVRSLTLGDAYALRDESFSLITAVPQVSTASQVVFGNSNWNTSIRGGTAALIDVQNLEVAHGISFSDNDVRSATKVCVLGPTVARELFGFSDPVDSKIRIRNVPFKVIGVTRPKGANSMGRDEDDFILVPITTVQRRLTRSGTNVNTVQQITAQAKSRDDLDTAKAEITALLRQRHRITDDSGQSDDFTISDLTSVLENAQGTVGVMSLLLSAVASISLITGGIGIMNIMLVSVTERTREIGIRMAIGARPSAVRWQFIIEAVTLSLVGGVIGILLGAAFAAMISGLFDWPTIISLNAILVAVGFSIAVGVFFGFWPAFKASRMDPIEALRAE